MKHLGFYLLVLFSLASCTQEEKAPNILFISIDDLRAELGIYGNPIIQTPNLDELANTGVAFSNHFVHVPTCGASRSSLLTGMRPRTKEQLQNNAIALATADKPEGEIPESFVHHLKRNGYYTVGIGKISHSADGLVYGYEEQPSTKRELPYSWDERPYDAGKWKTGWNAFFGYADGENRQSMKRQVKPYEAGEVDDDGYPDGLTAQLALKKLRELKEQAKPFFLGVGFFKPHLPFNAPKKYWDLYDRETIPISQNPEIPKNVNKSSLQTSGEFNGYTLGEEKGSLDKSVSDDYARKINHAYYAAVSYIDHQVGLLIEEVAKLDLAENTIIVVWGDHGWHLGDQRIWGKHTIFENALKSTLIFNVPGKMASGKTNQSIVETVDIYPTLLELTGIDAPYELDGKSFVDLINGPEIKRENVAYSYFRQGISMRTDRYRLTKYFRDETPQIELYDHDSDPLESINVASDHPDVVERLMPLLEKGNTGLYK